MPPKLPSHRHVPGTGTVPNRAALEPVKALTPRQVAGDNWSQVPAYAYGLFLYRHAFFWEAHEVWEAVWLATAPNSEERRLLAGLIQLANACLKLETTQRNAAQRLLQAARDHLDECHSPECLGLAPGALARDVGAFAALVAAHDGTGTLPTLVARRPTPVLADAG
jgi:hypothetical protein